MADKKFDSNTCLDIIGFQDYLKRLRVVDDTIILNLNGVLASTAQNHEEQNISNCNNFHSQLKQAYESRDKAIHVCLAEANDKVAQLKMACDKHDSDFNLLREFKRHQARLRMIQKELTVESIIQDRSLKALQERCRRYVNF